MIERRPFRLNNGWSRVLLLAFMFCPVLALAQNPPRPGRNVLNIRGHAVDCYYYPGDREHKGAGKVIFIPGDGGWRGVAVTMGKTMASWGYDVIGLDTKVYLEAFTGDVALRETEVMEDIHTIAEWMSFGEKVHLIGWSEGAGLAVLAAASPQYRGSYAGVATMSLSDLNVLGWRWRDDVTYLTRTLPNEPTFSTIAYLDKLSPLPLLMLQSSGDEFVSVDEARKLFEKAVEPKRYQLIEASNHRFDGNQQQMYRELQNGLAWMQGMAR